jgi:putative nucleotidyltransferase with HDIG domain
MAAAGMLIAILLDSRLAVLVVAVMSLILVLMTENQIRFGLVGMIGGITGVYSVSKLSQRNDLVRAGFYTSGANVVAIFIVGLVSGTPFALLISSSLALGITSGILSSILTNGSLPFLENTFRLTSPVRLLELSHPDNVLLKRLLTEAPGTYHHSIIVGNLAEAAADAVGSESLLVRVGAYYHDIGKIKRPYFFIENQMTCDNPHDKIAPSLSTLILTSHVKDGVEMAREHKLPQGIIDIIEQINKNKRWRWIMKNDQATFRTELMGFSKEDVNKYIEKTVEEYQNKIKERDDELATLRNQNKEFKSRLDEISKKEFEVDEIRSKISGVLIKAEEQAQKVVEDAKAAAIEEKKNIEEMIEKDKKSLSEIKKEILELKTRITETLKKFEEELDG